MTEKDLAEDYKMVLSEAKSMSCNKIRALYNIPIENMEMIVKALEKQIPKKYVHDGCFDSDGIQHEWSGVNGRPYDLCPNCNTNLCCEMPYDNKPKYCKHCGQRLDWSDEE